MSKSTTISTILLLMIGTATAYWPVTVEENLPVAAEPDTAELNACALPLAPGKTLLVYSAGWYGHCYQIIDKYGELELPNYHLLTPDLPYIDIYGNIKMIPDGEGGLLSPGALRTYLSLRVFTVNVSIPRGICFGVVTVPA